LIKFQQNIIHYILRSTRIWNKEELPQQFKESIIVPMYKKGDKSNCSSYRQMSLLSSTYKILSNILISWLIPYVYEITGNHQCGFCCNKSTIDHIFCICQMLEEKMEVYWDITSFIYTFWEVLWPSQERSIIQYSHWTHTFFFQGLGLLACSGSELIFWKLWIYLDIC